MALLTLNGTQVDCTVSRRSQVQIGQTSRAFNGALRRGRRAIKREWTFTTGPLSVAVAQTLRNLIDGSGSTAITAAGDFLPSGSVQVLGESSDGDLMQTGSTVSEVFEFTLREI
jgi:hypothetical protein